MTIVEEFSEDSASDYSSQLSEQSKRITENKTSPLRDKKINQKLIPKIKGKTHVIIPGPISSSSDID